MNYPTFGLNPFEEKPLSNKKLQEIKKTISTVRSNEIEVPIREYPTNSKYSKRKTNSLFSASFTPTIQKNNFGAKSKRYLITQTENRELMRFCNVFDSFDEDEDEIESEPFFLIKLEGLFQKTWDIFLMITIIYSGIFTPIQLCFGIHSTFFIILDIFIELALIADIFLSFFTEIEDFKENIISSSRIITESYLEGWFLLDLITCFPATLIEITINSHYIVYLKWFALIRLLKIFKYPYATHKNIIDNDRLDRVLKQIIYLIVIENIFSCFFVFLGLNGEKNNWITYHNLQNNNAAIYIASLYFHFLSLFTLGFGGIEGVNLSEKIYTIFILILDLFLYAFMLISMSKIFIIDSSKDISLNSNLSILRKFHKKFGIGKELKKEISDTLKLENEKLFGERAKFFKNLPENIKHQLNCYIYKNRIEVFNFFKSQTYDFITFTIPLLRNQKLKKSEYIFKIRETINEMFILIKGNISLRLGDDFSNLDVAVLRENDYFGDVFLFTGKTSPFDCIVRSNKTEVFIINKDDYFSLKNNFHRNIVKILENSLTSLELYNERKRNLINLFEQEKTRENVIAKIRMINYFLFERDFEDYFFNDQEIEGVNEFLVKNSFQNVKDVIHKMTRKKRQYNSEKICRFSNSIFKDVFNSPDRKEESKEDSILIRDKVNFNSVGSNIFNDNKSKKSISISMNTFFTCFDHVSKELNSEKVYPILKKNSDVTQMIKYENSMFNLTKQKSSFSKKKSFLITKEKSQFKNSPNNSSKRKKNKLSKSKYLKFLNQIYKVNFNQEIDITTIKKMRDIETKISKIIQENKNIKNIIHNIEPEFKKKFSGKESIVETKEKFFYSYEITTKLVEKNINDLEISRENSIHLTGSKTKFEGSNFKIIKKSFFRLKSEKCETFSFFGIDDYSQKNEKRENVKKENISPKNKESKLISEVFLDEASFIQEKLKYKKKQKNYEEFSETNVIGKIPKMKMNNKELVQSIIKQSIKLDLILNRLNIQ